MKMSGSLPMLDLITPVILTYNEAPNIARTLGQLAWAGDIVVVDSFSTDGTIEIVRSAPNVRLFQRKFDTHANQWNFAAFETDVQTEWVLALDADYLVTAAAVSELALLDASNPVDGYSVNFRYCIGGRPLRGTLYPPVTALFRKSKGSFYQDGHTHRLKLDGPASWLNEPFLHDDRKPLSHWLQAQDRYMKLEAENIVSKPWCELSFADKVRTFPLVAPFAVFANCYLLRLGILDGEPGLYYALQRMLAEALLSLRLIEKRLF